MYRFLGYSRSQGIFNGISYDKVRFCFAKFPEKSDGFGALPLIISGKLPSCKTSELSSLFGCELSELSSKVGLDCSVSVDRFGKVVVVNFCDE